MEPRGNENPGVDFLRQKSNKTCVEVVHATEAHTAQPKHANAAEGTSKGPAEVRTTQPHSAEACTAQTRPRNALGRTAQAKRANAAEETSKTNADAMQAGRGTALNDIPNVAYKLSREKSNETFKLLHAILFARRGKVTQIKSNISRFSGFVWHENEEKQKIKVKEKLDKCVKEKLVEICDVLDIPIVKATTRKEDIVVKLIEFLEAPHATTTELLAEKELSSKGKKLKRVSKGSGSASGSTPSKSSANSRKKADGASVKSEDELRAGICEILKEVDFNTATFYDILKQLAKRFNADLTPRKSSIKLMIEEELTKLADEADDEEDEGDGEKDNRRPSGEDVEA